MSTSKSPLSKLRVEAHRAAHHIFATWRTCKRKNPEFLQFAVCMDDGIRFVKLKWTDLETMTLAEIELVVLAAMQADPKDGGLQGSIISQDEAGNLH